jgi:hypothetical protein
MNTDATPMNPITYSLAAVRQYVNREAEEEPKDLADLFKMYGHLCFRNGFAVGFVSGLCAGALIVGKALRT